MEAVIAAAIALVGSLAGTYFANRKASALIAYRLEQLEKRVQAHNNLIDRMYRVEGRVDNLEQALEDHDELSAEKIKVANHRIEDLEKKVEG